MDFKVGDKVVYPNHGVGVIEQIKKQTIGGETSSFIRLKIIASDSTVMVPVATSPPLMEMSAPPVPPAGRVPLSRRSSPGGISTDITQ